MHLLGKILETASTNADESIAWMLLRKQDIDNFAGDVEDTHAFINNLLVLNNIKIAMMFRDDGPVVKMSLRSSGDFDVGTIAIALGGGGHSHSAATMIVKGPNETTEQVMEKTVKRVEELLKKLEDT